MSQTNGILARGPWLPESVGSRWLEDPYEVTADVEALADAEIAALQERGSPSYDGLAARLAGWNEGGGRLELELQPSRWALRLLDGAAANALTALCLVRSEDGRWLAGRRASWLATWADKWALGAGGSVEVGESPVETLARELHEEWQLTPVSLSVEALVGLPTGLVALIGMATVADGSEPVPDAEHDEFAWWPADVASWPDEADDRLKAVGALAAAGR